MILVVIIMRKAEIGSLTAKGGFLNEAKICEKFKNYKTDSEAQKWLVIMGYIPEKIQNLNAIQIPVRINKTKALELGIAEQKFEETIKFKKADIQVKIEIVIDNISYIENISLKKCNKSAGFNQIDKRPVATYAKIWGFNQDVEQGLKLFTGEITPDKQLDNDSLNHIKDKRRMFMNELPDAIFTKIIAFFEQNKQLIISDTIRGKGGLSAEWLLVTQKTSDNKISWVLKDINFVCNFYSQGKVQMSPRGSLKIGKITMQRKGGTPDPTSLQFKMNPLELFDAK